MNVSTHVLHTCMYKLMFLIVWGFLWLWFFGSIPFTQTVILTIAIKQLSHLASVGSNFSIPTNLFKCVQNGSKPSVSNWWKQCQRLTQLFSTVKGVTQHSSTHADGPIKICTCPYHYFTAYCYLPVCPWALNLAGVETKTGMQCTPKVKE